jgi:hypothetical protein
VQVFGQRFVGLIDDGGVYGTYGVPRPEAPYPQDYIIDQDGIVRYWSDEYDTQEIIAIIDNLITIDVEEHAPDTNSHGLNLEITPNPFSKITDIRYGITDNRYLITDMSDTEIMIYDASGRLVKDFSLPTAYSLLPTTVSWDGTDQFGQTVSAGTYFVRLESAGQTLTKTVVLSR